MYEIFAVVASGFDSSLSAWYSKRRGDSASVISSGVSGVCERILEGEVAAGARLRGVSPFFPSVKRPPLVRRGFFLGLSTVDKPSPVRRGFFLGLSNFVSSIECFREDSFRADGVPLC